MCSVSVADLHVVRNPDRAMPVAIHPHVMERLVKGGMAAVGFYTCLLARAGGADALVFTINQLARDLNVTGRYVSNLLRLLELEGIITRRQITTSTGLVTGVEIQFTPEEHPEMSEFTPEIYANTPELDSEFTPELAASSCGRTYARAKKWNSKNEKTERENEKENDVTLKHDVTLPPPNNAPPSKLTRYPAEFDTFWSAYPKGRGVKTKTYEQWRKLSEAERQQALAAVAIWRQSPKWANPQYIRHAERWLQYREFEQDPGYDDPFSSAPRSLSAADLIAMARGEA